MLSGAIPRLFGVLIWLQAEGASCPRLYPYVGQSRLGKKLLILGCADRKRDSGGFLPALDRYDGPAYRVIRKYLREYQWPEDVSIAVLSAEHGLFGILKGIKDYDKKMDVTTAKEHASESSTTLSKWATSHQSIHVSLGKDYMPAVQPALDLLGICPQVFEGPIGQKLNQIKTFLTDTSSPRRIRATLEGGTGRYSYFLPDWDDLLDPAFDFDEDSFSGTSRTDRQDKHCCVLMLPNRMSDGMVVSLAQQGTQKGPLRHLKGTEFNSLAPPPLRKHFGLSTDQYLFGDCGAFSYVNGETPTITVDQAVALYESYGFDLGASVDHIPVAAVKNGGKRRELSMKERQDRVDLTYKNAQQFIEAANKRKVGFIPVGTIQALRPEQYAQAVWDYYSFGYRHLAIGGLVPKGDADIAATVRSVMQAADQLPERPWVHLFGIYRPKLQILFRELKVDSFDSASYFRKAWLRSDQNYLAPNGRWYAALRVPMTSDGRTRIRLQTMDIDIEALRVMERKALKLLSQYDGDQVKVDEVLDAVLTYDSYLARSSDTRSMYAKYRRTLVDRPWQSCHCTFCKALGIHMLVFRGANRNKRRGAHNTLMLYGQNTRTS